MSAFEKTFKWAVNLFPLWSVLVAVVALRWPAVFLWYGKEAISVGLGLIMLGMGLTLEVEDFRRVARRPAAVGLGVVLQFAVMPLLGWGIAWAFGLSEGFAVGLILVACCPGGTASNVVAFLARADVALSVSMTAASTLAAVFLTPFLTQFYAGQYVPVDAWGLFRSIALIVILPVAAGVAVNRFFKGAAAKASSFSPFVSVLFILLIVGSIMAANRDAILGSAGVLVPAIVLLHVVGFAAGYLLASLCGFKESIRRAASIEVGMQNSGLGAALATKHFASLPMAPVPCALSAVTHCILGSIAAGLWRRTGKKG